MSVEEEDEIPYIIHTAYHLPEICISVYGVSVRNRVGLMSVFILLRNEAGEYV